MREILFRGKRTDNVKWIYGYILKFPDGDVYMAAEYGTDNELYKHQIFPDTVGQYTGLTDKNGAKIFEGDIVKLPKCENDIAAFVIAGCNYFLKGKHSDYAIGSYEGDCEVIGNIHDNPELLEV